MSSFTDDQKPSAAAAKAAGALLSPAGMLLLASGAAALCGATVHLHGYVVLLTLLSVIAIGALWPWLSVRSIRATLRFTRPRGREGEPVEVQLHVRNLGPLPIDGVGLVGMPGPDGESITLALPPFATRVNRWQFAPPGRGQFPQNAAFVRCGFPFGLWFPARLVSVEQPLLVWPARVPVDHLVALPVTTSTDGSVPVRTPDVHGESVGVRHYRHGDAAKLVLRAQTARYDRLIVREVAPTTVPSLRIVLDSAASSYADPALRESAIRFAGSFFEAAVARGRTVGLVVEARLLKSGPRAVEQALDALAKITEPGGPSLAQLIGHPACTSHNAAVIVITSAAAIESTTGHSRGKRSSVRLVAVEFLATSMTCEGVSI